jgi:hypothetical protein
VAGTEATITGPGSTTAQASTSFTLRFGRLRRQLAHGLKQVENGNLAGAGPVLTNCTDTVTSRLGSRTENARQQQAVSQLRTACADVAGAVSKLEHGDTAAASRLAQTALQEVEAAGRTAR